MCDVVLHVPPSCVPEFYTSATPDEILTALKLGAQLFETMKSLRIEESDEAYKKEIKRINDKYKLDLQHLQEELSNTQKELVLSKRQHYEELQTISNDHNLQLEEQRQSIINSLKASHEQQTARYIERNEQLQQRILLIQSERDKDIEKAEARLNSSLQLILEEKQRVIERQERQLDKWAEELRNNSAVIQSLISKKNQSVKEKGADFETVFRGLLETAFMNGPGFSLENTASSGIGHAGDYIMKWDNKSILWEVKNYDKIVPTHEVDKFIRDMRMNPDCSIGVMVSRNTDITGKNKTGQKAIEFMEDRMLIYLNTFDTMPQSTLQDLMLLFKTFWHISRNFESMDSIESAIKTVEKLHSEAVSARTAWRVHKAHNDTMIKWVAEQLDASEERLQNTLQNLQGLSINNDFDYPKDIFRDVTGETKSLEYIKEIMNIYEAVMDAECVLNDVAQELTSKFNVSRETMKEKIISVINTHILVTTKGKPTKLKGLRRK
jgi:hypothetical protein